MSKGGGARPGEGLDQEGGWCQEEDGVRGEDGVRERMININSMNICINVQASSNWQARFAGYMLCCGILTYTYSVVMDTCSVLTDTYSVVTDTCSAVTDTCSVLTDTCNVFIPKLILFVVWY